MAIGVFGENIIVYTCHGFAWSFLPGILLAIQLKCSGSENWLKLRIFAKEHDFQLRWPIHNLAYVYSFSFDCTYQATQLLTANLYYHQGYHILLIISQASLAVLLNVSVITAIAVLTCCSLGTLSSPLLLTR